MPKMAAKRHLVWGRAGMGFDTMTPKRMIVPFVTIQNMYSFCMPKVTEAHRDARRAQIGRAAIVALQRKGFSTMSMADIIAESGLSAGAIYSNFAGKSEIARYVASTIIGPRVLLISQTPGSPTEIAGRMLDGLEQAHVPLSVIVQVWAEATVDPELHDVVTGVVGQLRSAIGLGITDWVAERHPKNADVETERLASVLLTVCQGYIVNAALFGAGDAGEYLASAGDLLGVD